VSDVQGLLGTNLQDLKTFENDTVVRSWISQQFQSELDKLNIGLTGGKADTTTVAPTVTATTVKITAGAPGEVSKNHLERRHHLLTLMSFQTLRYFYEI